jgi:hypothetical protein
MLIVFGGLGAFERELIRRRKEEGIAGYSTGNPLGAVQQDSAASPLQTS